MTWGRFALVAALGACVAPRPAPIARDAPVDFRLPDLDGRARSADELRGRVVLVDLWATWCAACRVSLPIYDRWQRELGDRGFTVVAVAVDDDAAAVAAFARARAPNLIVLRDPDAALAARFDLPALPSTFLLDRAGHRVDAPADELRAAIERLLGAP